uniref:Uncharacterized protein n=1 Tax=Timema monikensis TaxID=170555 RepID=A0A7R9HQZ0_9NEOP|nr:unnamed protein product [Timema monikensis]
MEYNPSTPSEEQWARDAPRDWAPSLAPAASLTNDRDVGLSKFFRIVDNFLSLNLDEGKSDDADKSEFDEEDVKIPATPATSASGHVHESTSCNTSRSQSSSRKRKMPPDDDDENRAIEIMNRNLVLGTLNIQQNKHVYPEIDQRCPI